MNLRILAWLALAACSGSDTTVPVGTDDGGGLDQDDDGYSVGQGDCDDNNADIYPGANDVFGDDEDFNCDGVDGIDDDGDGMASRASGGEDCDDDDPLTYDGADEVGWDGIDQDCDDDDLHDFELLAAGDAHTCGIASAGQIECWGDDEYGQLSDKPAGEDFIAIDAGGDFTCAVRANGEALCWGRDETEGEKVQGLLSPPSGDWFQISVSTYFGCLLDREGYVTCWGDDEYGQITDAPSNSTFSALSVGAQHVCGIRRNGGGISCWGSDISDQITFAPTDAGYLRIASGSNHTCAVRQDQGLRCWGEDAQDQTEPPSDAGPYTYVSGSVNTSCGIISNRDLSCWGSDAQQQVSGIPTDREFNRVEVGSNHVCATDLFTEEASCWGDNSAGQATVPF